MPESGDDNNPVIQVIKASFPVEIFDVTVNEITNVHWYPFFVRLSFFGFILAYISSFGILFFILTEDYSIGISDLWSAFNPLILGLLVILLMAIIRFIKEVNSGRGLIDSSIAKHPTAKIIIIGVKIGIGISALYSIIRLLYQSIGSPTPLLEIFRFLVVIIFLVGMLLIGGGFTITGLYDAYKIRQEDNRESE